MNAKKKVFLGHFRSFKKKCKKNANKVVSQKKKHNVLFALLSSQPPKKVKKNDPKRNLMFFRYICATILSNIPKCIQNVSIITKRI